MTKGGTGMNVITTASVCVIAACEVVRLVQNTMQINNSRRTIRIQEASLGMQRASLGALINDSRKAERKENNVTSQND